MARVHGSVWDAAAWPAPRGACYPVGTMAPRSAAAPAAFAGFSDTRAKFFRELAKHQDRTWFKAHQAEYERLWHEPMQALLEELHARLDPLFRKPRLAPPKIFRLQRDIRFSADKSPYKTHIAGVLHLG